MEKLPQGLEAVASMERLERLLGRTSDALMPIEAGDVTGLFSHQVLTAAHEGATAAAALAYDLYRADKEAVRALRNVHETVR